MKRQKLYQILDGYFQVTILSLLKREDFWYDSCCRCFACTNNSTPVVKKRFLDVGWGGWQGVEYDVQTQLSAGHRKFMKKCVYYNININSRGTTKFLQNLTK